MTTTPTDRAAAVRAAMRTVVAEHGFHGASMSAVAQVAGVATGTAYTHYASKDALVIATYCETKSELGRAAASGIDRSLPPGERFRALWLAYHDFLRSHPEHARFLLQVEHSPYRGPAHDAALADQDDPLVAQVTASDLLALLLPLPDEVLYDLALGPAVRLAAAGAVTTPAQLEEIAAACWRAVTVPA
ncbi:TetR/AcrR family transcriptional regulator [Nocardioides marmorisolisilvae]|uniref:TetR/AcrR family transcriptional regulator n=1 Tax=Nocardioides marmorisolisilvae TaxID=1542737 RepID=A0A3N0DZV9_9ACTN|nr:TetR/AcrR family transcriptional regulator [Nocardioides marmorisolisilvae]RNL81149.1 TetR/AcrR family transcriptional regulator [Nocardioides marmorisolisilvae]